MFIYQNATKLYSQYIIHFITSNELMKYNCLYCIKHYTGITQTKWIILPNKINKNTYNSSNFKMTY